MNADEQSEKRERAGWTMRAFPTSNLPTMASTLQLALKKALLVACHGQRQAMESPEVLLAAVAQAGLDVARAQSILASDEFAAEVRAAESFFADQGIHSVPAIIINRKHLISGGQPVAVFAQALRQIAAEG
jgi:predicted DsbA family dithiol-disulfide isomerase